MSIQISNIPKAGLGVFVEEDIPANTLLCCYLGELDIGRNMKEGLDGSFSIGWI
jgi:hypothetical protein